MKIFRPFLAGMMDPEIERTVFFHPNHMHIIQCIDGFVRPLEEKDRIYVSPSASDEAINATLHRRGIPWGRDV